jgi:hypothetical protein
MPAPIPPYGFIMGVVDELRLNAKMEFVVTLNGENTTMKKRRQFPVEFPLREKKFRTWVILSDLRSWVCTSSTSVRDEQLEVD